MERHPSSKGNTQHRPAGRGKACAQDPSPAASVPQASQSAGARRERAGGGGTHPLSGPLALRWAVSAHGHRGTRAGPRALGLKRSVTCRVSGLTSQAPARGPPNACHCGLRIMRPGSSPSSDRSWLGSLMPQFLVCKRTTVIPTS